MDCSSSASSSSCCAEDILHDIQVLRKREAQFYPILTRQRMFTPYEQECRKEMGKWCYRIVDHCHIDRNIVAMAMHMVDRYVHVVAGATTPVDMQLAAMTALYSMIKVHAHSALSLESMLILCGHRYTAIEMVDMERDLLKATRWLTHPPTATHFAKLYLDYCLLVLEENDPSSCPTSPTTVAVHSKKRRRTTARPDIHSLEESITSQLQERVVLDDSLSSTLVFQSTVAWNAVQNVLANHPSLTTNKAWSVLRATIVPGTRGVHLVPPYLQPELSLEQAEDEDELLVQLCEQSDVLQGDEYMMNVDFGEQHHEGNSLFGAHHKSLNSHSCESPSTIADA